MALPRLPHESRPPLMMTPNICFFQASGFYLILRLVPLAIMRGLLTAPGLESVGLSVAERSSRHSPGRGSMWSLTNGRGACAPGWLPAQGLGQARPTYPVGTESGPILHLLLWKVMVLDSLLPQGPSHPVFIPSPMQGSALRANRLTGHRLGIGHLSPLHTGESGEVQKPASAHPQGQVHPHVDMVGGLGAA